jgi:hypothetical protein
LNAGPVAQVTLEFGGNEEFIAALAAELAGARREDARVVSRGVVEDATELSLSLDTVEALVAIISQLFFNGPLVPALLHAFRKSANAHCHVRGPAGEFTFVPPPDMTDDQVREVLHRLVDM